MAVNKDEAILPLMESQKADDGPASQASHERPEWKRNFRPALLVFLPAVLLLYGIFTSTTCIVDWRYAPNRSGFEKVTRPETDGQGRRVPLEAHIMSKCPDARDCLRHLVVPAMAKASEKVDFKLSYIGQPTNDDDGVSCKHGPSECLGDILELCAASLYPSPKNYLGFTMCMSDEYEHIPSESLVSDCALEHGINFDKLNDCASQDDGSYGIDMLRKSVEHSMARNVTISCTVRLEDKIWCIRDDGKWKDCEAGHEPKDLVREIDRLYNNTRTS